MTNPFSNQLVFFGESIPDSNHYLRQLVGYCSGIGTKYYEHLGDNVKFIITEDFDSDKILISKYLSSIILAKNKDKLISSRLTSMQKLTTLEFLEIISNSPAKAYLK